MNAEQKEKFLEMLSDAIDNDAVGVSLTFFGMDKSKNEAMEEAATFSEILNSKVEVSNNNKVEWFRVDSGLFSAGFFHKEGLEAKAV